MNDYRETKYCQDLSGIPERKSQFMEEFNKEHPRARDVHAYVSPNNSKYKTKFIDVYKGKCAYCGVSISLMPKEMFEIDHYLPKEMSRFKTKADAGYIENLILSCRTCNHNKSSFEISDELHNTLHPDYEEIKNAFYRDDLFYIRVSDGQPSVAIQFYNQLQLGRETARIDYLLMCMRGFYERVANNPDIHDKVGQAIILLQSKRNYMA